MYIALLNAALAEAHSPGDDPSTHDAVEELLRRRSSLYSRGPSRVGTFWAPDALANELAYDMALIKLADLLRIDWEVDHFDRPGQGRARLELALMSRGIHLDDFGTRGEATSTTNDSSASGS